MQVFTAEQAAQAVAIHNENSKSVAGSSSKINQLRDKHHNDVDIIAKWRVSVPKGATAGIAGPNRAPTVVVLNHKYSDVNIMPEHGFYYPNNAKNKFRYEPCLDFANAKLPNTKCPICKAAQQNLHNAKFPYMRMALTVLMERIDASGTTIAWDKKLLVVKHDNFKTFNNLFVTGEKTNNGIIRGMAFALERGTGDTTLASGAPALNADNSFAFSFVGEEWLAQVQALYQPTEVRSEDKKYIYKPVNWLTTPIDINNSLDILNYSSEEDLRKEFDPSYAHNLAAAPALAVPQVVAPVAAPAVGLPAVPVATPAPSAPSVPVAPLQPGIEAPVNGIPAALAAVSQAVPAVPVVPQTQEMPALAAQRNLTPTLPPVGAANADEVDLPWETEE